MIKYSESDWLEYEFIKYVPCFVTDINMIDPRDISDRSVHPVSNGKRYRRATSERINHNGIKIDEKKSAENIYLLVLKSSLHCIRIINAKWHNWKGA